MKNLFVSLVVTAFSTLTLAQVTTRSMQANEFAAYLVFAAFPNDNCILASDLSLAQMNSKITFTLHTKAKDYTVIMNSSDSLTYSFDSDTGSETISGQGLEVKSTQAAFSQISVGEGQCNP